ncbi:hypothetical protein NXY15_22215 [Bacteroides thetaiotaomicron]|nr:hypothetical protein NXY15_22215 [Bacteroides thetaiotaomicron]
MYQYPALLESSCLLLTGATKQLAIEEAMRQLHTIQNEPLLSANIKMTEWLQQGLDVSYRASDGQIRCDHLKADRSRKYRQ